MHIAFTLITAQVLGSIATILARAIAPDNVGPGDVFPDFSFYSPGDTLEVFQKPWFYICLFSQILICVGYFLFFRKVRPSSVPKLIAGTTSEAIKNCWGNSVGEMEIVRMMRCISQRRDQFIFVLWKSTNWGFI